jgi:NitT/TauT family transport system permease protein
VEADWLQTKPTKTEPAARRGLAWRGLVTPLVFALALLAWEGVVRLGGYPTFILPSPGRVGATLLRVVGDGTLWRHAQVTLVEVLGGLALGLSVATVLGYALAKSVTIERALSPYIVASQAVPIVAIAPLLVIWFGPGLLSKMLISALIVFFPILINTVVGVRSVEPDLRDLMRSLRATRWQVFAKLEMPAALPVLLGGLKIGATLSVIGAVVGEFAGAERGLGYLITLSNNALYDTPQMFVAILALVVMALGLYGIVALIERRMLAWRRNGHQRV